MVAVPLPCNGHYGSLLGALRDGRGLGRRGGSVPRSFRARERRGGVGRRGGGTWPWMPLFTVLGRRRKTSP